MEPGAAMRYVQANPEYSEITVKIKLLRRLFENNLGAEPAWC